MSARVAHVLRQVAGTCLILSGVLALLSQLARTSIGPPVETDAAIRLTIVSLLMLTVGVGLKARQHWAFAVLYVLAILSYFVRLSLIPFLGIALNLLTGFQVSRMVVLVANLLFAGTAVWVHAKIWAELLWHPFSSDSQSSTGRPRKVTLLQEFANVHQEAIATSPVIHILKKGDVLYLQDGIKSETQGWVSVDNTSGVDGFILADTGVKEVIATRFMTERTVFIGMASLLAGLVTGIYGLEVGPPVIGVMGITAFLMTGVYVTTEKFTGMGGFYESIPVDTAAPAFDWRKVLIDPLYFIGLVIVLLLLTGVSTLVVWALKGANS